MGGFDFLKVFRETTWKRFFWFPWGYRFTILGFGLLIGLLQFMPYLSINYFQLNPRGSFSPYLILFLLKPVAVILAAIFIFKKFSKLVDTEEIQLTPVSLKKAYFALAVGFSLVWLVFSLYPAAILGTVVYGLTSKGTLGLSSFFGPIPGVLGESIFAFAIILLMFLFLKKKYRFPLAFLAIFILPPVFIFQFQINPLPMLLHLAGIGLDSKNVYWLNFIVSNSISAFISIGLYNTFWIESFKEDSVDRTRHLYAANIFSGALAVFAVVIISSNVFKENGLSLDELIHGLTPFLYLQILCSFYVGGKYYEAKFVGLLMNILYPILATIVLLLMTPIPGPGALFVYTFHPVFIMLGLIYTAFGVLSGALWFAGGVVRQKILNAESEGVNSEAR